MKLVRLALIAVVTFPGVSGAYAQAFDASGLTYDHGKARFTGAIVNTPCSITADSLDQTIDLGSFTSKELDHGGISGSTPFEINLEDCDISEQNTVAVTFSGGADAKDNRLLGLTGTAAGAGIVIADMSGEPLDLGTESEAQKLQNGHNTLHFSAWLKGDSPADTVTPGDFTSVANFQLAYN
ncbi:fimbrial protein [Klebsiella aerogenes]|uniref:fimbrial protein n=1 Tax=Klebsiella aerogenes TaxID=548 RepID=UPI001F189920|nr:fimbrial protein [Klebsiella aerogenes]